MRVTYFAAASRDGYIATRDGGVAWLDELDIDPAEAGLEEFIASVDGLVMGRGTYDFVFQYGSWPYGDKLTWVCSQRTLQPMDGANLVFASRVEDVVVDAAERGLKHLWLVGGGKLASSLVSARLLSHVSISEMPIELGDGIPLFSDHSLDTIPASKRTESAKAAFRQIEVCLDHG